MTDMKLTYCNILGTNINVTNLNDTVSYLEEHLDSLRGEYICVSNVHTTVMAWENDDYRKVQNCAAMALPDGKPLSIVSRMRGFKDAERVPGPDLMPRIFECSREKRYRHFFYGSKQETLDKLILKLEKMYPWLKIVGAYAPPFRSLTEQEDEQITCRINEAKPDFVWIALGAPKQEIWMNEHKGRIRALMIGVGAAFDFHAGTVKRAPKWMQELCLEWFYRILQDPIRLIPRYIYTNTIFLKYVHQENKQLSKKAKMNRESLKIAMIGHKRIPSREGGVEIVVNELSTRLAARGHRVDAYNRRGSHVAGKEFINSIGKEYKGVRIITIPTFENKSFNAIVYSFLASVRVIFGKYDVVHYHAEGPCAMLWIPRLFCRRIVVTIHGLDWQRSKWGNFASRVLKFGEKVAVKYADEMIVLSANMQEYFGDNYGRRTIFVPNGINRPEYREVQEIQKNWGLQKNEYILFLARIVPEKGAHYLIEAYSRLHTNKKLVIAGGRSHSADYYKKLHEMAADTPNIIFTDFVGGRSLEELFANACLFVLPSDVEGMAISLLEAMSYGNCCLVSDISENVEVIEDCGVTFQHGNVDDLTEKMRMLLENADKIDEYKKRACDFVCKKFDWDKIVGQTIQVYLGEFAQQNGE